MVYDTSEEDLILSLSSFYYWSDDYHLPTFLRSLRKYYSRLDIDGVDLYFDPYNLSEELRFDSGQREFLNKFNYRILHTDFHDTDWEGTVDWNRFERCLEEIHSFGKHVGSDHIVVHGDCLVSHPDQVIDYMKNHLPDLSISFELMDEHRNFATRPEHLNTVLGGYEDIGVVVDTAHLQDFTETVSWTDLFHDPSFSSRINFVHLSNHTSQLDSNWYAKQGYDEIEAVHSLCIADPSRFDSEYLDECLNYPVVLEGIIPPGERGIDFLSSEIEFVRSRGELPAKL